MATTPIHGVGSEVGPYRIEELLGRGGMGVVYRALDLRLGRPVALKLLSPELSGDEQFRARFERESRLAASIDHGGIVPVYDAGDVGGQLYIAMRFVDGGDLAQLLRRQGPLEPVRALDLVGQLAEALDAAHARALIHRDVKPSNALVSREGAREHVYLADFGLTKTSGRDTVTASGQIMGTVAYMAPEVIRGETPAAAGDLYALGCVLFECLTGEVPYPGANEAAVIYGHLETPPPRASDRAAHLPAALDPVLDRALAKGPGQRFESGAAMMGAARDALGLARLGRTHRRRRARPRKLLIAAVGLAAAVTGVAVVWPEGDRKIAAIESDAVAVIDPGDSSLRAKVELDGPPAAVASAPNAIWVAGDRDGTVSRIDPKTNTVRQTVPVGHGQSALAADRDGVWVANRQDGTVSLISAATNTVTAKFTIGSPSDACLLDGDVWVAGAAAGAVMRLDPDTHRRRAVPVDANPAALACGAGGVWAVSDSGRLIQIDPATNAVKGTAEVGAGASALAAGSGEVWVANSVAGTVARVDAERSAVTATVALGAADEPVAVAVGAGGVWVANRRARTLARIDPESTAVTKQFPLGNEPSALTVVDDRLWVAVAATGAGHRGGTLRLAFPGPPPPVRDFDPATAYSPAGSLLSLTNDGLTAFRRVGGAAGATLVPDLAETLPVPSDGGRTYRFTMRRGVRFSTGRPVRPSDVERGIKRSLAAKPRTYGVLDGIASVAADDAHGTIVIRLRRPDPDFLYRLAWPFASAVPPGTGASRTIVAATGPYRIARFERGRRVRLERNRFYRTWAAPAKPDGYPDVIEVSLGRPESKVIGDVGAGRTDWMFTLSASSALTRLRRTDPGLIRELVRPSTVWLFLNTRVPPFDRRDARRAVSLAIDRRAVVASLGGPHTARATCHILPPTIPGYRPGCPGEDLAAARRLVARSGTRGAHVELRGSTLFFGDVTLTLARALRKLGYDTTVRAELGPRYFERVADSSTRTQAGLHAWLADYPSPSNFFLPLFSCRSFIERSTDNANVSEYCDPKTDALMRQAAELRATDPLGADELWAQVERRVLDAAPAIPLTNPVDSHLVSTRVRNDQYNPQWGFLPDQAWVR